MSQPLLPITQEERAYLNARTVVSAIDAKDFPDWQARLQDLKRSPLEVMLRQRQEMNDCQGQATANGVEARHWYCTGDMLQRSDIYAYNACEYISNPNRVGANRGTSIASGVRLVTEGIKSLNVEPGLPLTTDWPYKTYETSASRFASRARSAKIVTASTAEHGPLPDFEGVLIALAAGGTGHIGTSWPPKWTTAGGTGPYAKVRLMDSPPQGGGGHATEIIWAVLINGRWYLAVWNSHGDGFYLMSQRCYEILLQSQFSPYGGYLLMPDKRVERYHDRRTAGGGYVLGGGNIA